MLLDVLTGFDKIQVCTAYKMGGEVIKEFPASLEDLAKCEPIYEELEGWSEDITTVERFEDLPYSKFNYLTIHAANKGVGGDDSWGAPVHKKYRLKHKKYEQSFIIKIR